MPSSAKSYANTVLKGYASTLNKLKDRYTSVLSAIDKEHDAKNKKIDEESKLRKNQADSANKIALKNTKLSLLEKGLSRSGDSVQADIDSNIARNTAFSQIEQTASRQKQENELARSQAKSSAFKDYLDSVNSAETQLHTAYSAQLNKDRQYEAERDDEMYRRYADERDYEAKRDDEEYDRYADNRDYEAKRDDEKHDRYVQTREYEAERDDEMYDRYADERDYKAERDDEKYDRYTETREFESKSGDTGTGGTYDDGKDNRIEPEMSPQEFVDKINLVYSSKSYPTYMKKKAAIRAVIENIINDQSLTYSYRHQVKIYAESIGIY